MSWSLISSGFAGQPSQMPRGPWCRGRGSPSSTAPRWCRSRRGRPGTAPSASRSRPEGNATSRCRSSAYGRAFEDPADREQRRVVGGDQRGDRTRRSRPPSSAAPKRFSGPAPPGEEPGADERPADQRRERPRRRSAIDVEVVAGRGRPARAPTPAAKPGEPEPDQRQAQRPQSEQLRDRRAGELVLGHEAARAAAREQLARVRPVAARGEHDGGRRRPSPVSRAATSKPSRSGSWTSSRTRSGRRRARLGDAPSAPSAASPTTS